MIRSVVHTTTSPLSGLFKNALFLQRFFVMSDDLFPSDSICSSFLP